VVISPDELESELEKLAREAEEHRKFLERLETLKAEGRISETTYEQLGEEHLDTLKTLEARIGEPENMKGAGAVRSSVAHSTTEDN
jgi:uncharacterized protein YciI